MVVVHDRSPDGRDDFERLIGGVLDLDRFFVVLELAQSVGRLVRILVGFVSLHDHDVDPVAFAIGKAPGHVTVRANRNHRRARQRNAGDPLFLFGILICWPHKAGAIPDVRHANAQMHVVGHKRPTVRRVLARDDPIVAARVKRIGRRLSARRR